MVYKIIHLPPPLEEVKTTIAIFWLHHKVHVVLSKVNLPLNRVAPEQAPVSPYRLHTIVHQAISLQQAESLAIGEVSSNDVPNSAIPSGEASE